MMAKFTIFKKARYCPNARTGGYNKHSVEVGDLILYEESYVGGGTGERLARVLGLANELPSGEDPGTDTLVVLACDEMLTFAFERYVKLDRIRQVRTPSGSRFAEWFLSGPVPHPETAIAVTKYGAMSDRYIDKYLEDDGTLPANFREKDRVAG